jgi:hypothetical protein
MSRPSCWTYEHYSLFRDLGYNAFSRQSCLLHSFILVPPPHLLSSSHGYVPWCQKQQIQWFCCNEFQGSSPCSLNSISTSVSFLPPVVLFFPSVNMHGHVTTSSGTMLRCSPPSNHHHHFRFINYSIKSESGTWDDCLLLLFLSHQGSHLLLS